MHAAHQFAHLSTLIIGKLESHTYVLPQSRSLNIYIHIYTHTHIMALFLYKLASLITLLSVKHFFCFSTSMQTVQTQIMQILGKLL